MNATGVLDDLARTLAQPMPRRRALRLLGATAVAAMVPGGKSHAARVASSGTCAPDQRVCPILKQLAPAEWCCPGGIPARRYRCDGDYYNPHCSDTCGGPDDLPCTSPKKDKDGFSYFICCSKKYHSGCENGACVRKQICGPDVTDAVDDTLQRVKSDFGGWSSTKRAVACANLVTLPGAAISWDVHELGPGGRERFAKQHRPSCSTCGFSVQVGQDCHYSGSVNYAAFGVMMRLCRDHYSKEESAFADWFSSEEMLELIYTYKTNVFTGTQAANFQAANAWALAGFHSGSVRPTPPGDRKQQCERCSKPYTGPGFRYRWLGGNFP